MVLNNCPPSFQDEADIYIYIYSTGPGFSTAGKLTLSIKLCFLYKFAMFLPVPCLFFLLLSTICSFTSLNPDALPADNIASLDFGPNGIGIPPESQDEADKMSTDAGGLSEAPPLIIQGNKDQCDSDSIQSSWRKARSKRASFCLPLTDDGHPVVQDSTGRKKRRPGTKWQIVPQRTENDFVERRCPGTEPFPVCALSTVATIRPEPSSLNTGSASGRWILDYCRCKYSPLPLSFYPWDLFLPTRNLGKLSRLINAPMDYLSTKARNRM